MDCLFCKGKMKKATTAYTINRKGYHLYIEKIPTYLCTQCGEKYFDEKETRAIQDMLKVFEKKLERVIAA